MQRRCIHNSNNAFLIRLWNPGKYDRIAQVADIISANLNLNLSSQWLMVRTSGDKKSLISPIRQLSHVWHDQAGNTNCVWLDTRRGQCCHHQHVFIIMYYRHYTSKYWTEIHCIQKTYNTNRKTSNQCGHTLISWQMGSNQKEMKQNKMKKCIYMQHYSNYIPYLGA